MNEEISGGGQTVAYLEMAHGYSVSLSWVPGDNRYEILISSPNECITENVGNNYQNDYASAVHAFADAIIKVSAIVQAVNDAGFRR